MRLVLNELTTLVDLGLIDMVLAWRERMTVMLTGPSPSLEQATRAVVALGGLSDCTIQFRHVPAVELRVAAVDAACAALGIKENRAGENRTGTTVV